MTLICAICKANALHRCSKCHQEVYCGRSCQATDWPVHKKVCGKTMKISAAEAAPTVVNMDLLRIPLVPLEGSGYAQWLRENDVKVPERIVPVCGLRNLGNTCYLNAAIQALSCTPMLQSMLQSVQHLKAHKSPHSCFLCAFEEISRGLLQSRGPLSPSYLLSQTKRKMFGKLPSSEATFGGQADAPECLGFLLELIQDSIVDKAALGPAEIEEAERTSMIGHLFSFDIEQTVFCDSCSADSNRNGSELFLRLEITTGMAEHELSALYEPTDWFWRRKPPASTSTNLNELIQHYHQPEPLNDYKCGGCNKRGSCQKQTRISRLPNVLLILLDQNKNSGMFGKVDRKVYFPLELFIGNCEYALYAMIVHVDFGGRTYIGHYVCFVYEGDGRWLMCDDARVVEVSSEYVAQQQPLLVLYQLRLPDKNPPSPRYNELSSVYESAVEENEKVEVPLSSKNDQDEKKNLLSNVQNEKRNADFGNEQTLANNAFAERCGQILVVGKPASGDRTPETRDDEPSCTDTESDMSAPSVTST